MISLMFRIDNLPFAMLRPPRRRRLTSEPSESADEIFVPTTSPAGQTTT
jgi:hypothetical protein